jgi:hypothetical protein
MVLVLRKSFRPSTRDVFHNEPWLAVVQDTGADPVNVVCRICEETVAANQLDGHTKHCQSVHQLDNKTATTDVRLRKIVEALRQRREQSNVQQVRAHCNGHLTHDGYPMIIF